MDRVEISIVMPVHNTGKYLEESLHSVFDQTFQKFEIICVDDASKDEMTSKILHKFQSEHANMQIVKMDSNRGAAFARNIGFSKTQGEYVMFLDADDIFHREMLNKLYHKTVETHADVCECGFQSFYVENDKKIFAKVHCLNPVGVLGRKNEEWLLYHYTAPWNKLCRKKFLLENEISFQELPSCNDVFFTCMVLKKANVISYLPSEVLIDYRTKTDTQISSNRNPSDLINAIECIVRELQKEEIYDEITQKQITMLLMRNMVAEIRECNREEWCVRAYELTQGFLRKSDLSYSNKLYSEVSRIWKGLTYADKWFYPDQWFYYMLRGGSEKLKQLLRGKERIFLWGNGKRGIAFQKLCREENIILLGLADKKNIDIGTITEEGYRIFKTEEVMEMADLIIASNSNIYADLRKRWNRAEVINLEEFCPNFI